MAGTAADSADDLLIDENWKAPGDDHEPALVADMNTEGGTTRLAHLPIRTSGAARPSGRERLADGDVDGVRAPLYTRIRDDRGSDSGQASARLRSIFVACSEALAGAEPT